MKTTLKYILIFMLFTHCKAQNNTKTETKMKTFDIETFNKNKNHLNEYSFYAEDSIKIYQKKRHSEYKEVIKNKDSYFEIINRYYFSGKLKSTVHFFPNQFLKGVLKEYDEQGNLIKETDYDAPYKFTWEDILAFIKKRKIDMDNYYLEIGRNIVDGNPVWSIIWEKEDKSSLRIVGIDGITGKVFQENDRDYPGLD